MFELFLALPTLGCGDFVFSIVHHCWNLGILEVKQPFAQISHHLLDFPSVLCLDLFIALLKLAYQLRELLVVALTSKLPEAIDQGRPTAPSLVKIMSFHEFA